MEFSGHWLGRKDIITPIGLAISGLDPSGSAGLITDILTMSAFGLHPQGVATASTIQSVDQLAGYRPVYANLLRKQVEMLFASHAPSAIKIGMLGDEPIVSALASILKGTGRRVPIVLDPVLMSSSGRPLITDAGYRAMVAKLIPMTTVLTPNIAEAESLAGMKIEDEDDYSKIAEKLFGLGAENIIIKGGHAAGKPVDRLYSRSKQHLIRGARIGAPDVRGTGCAYSAAVAACLAKGCSVLEAARQAKKFVASYIGSASGRQSGMQWGVLPKVWEIQRIMKKPK
jgi:hydroxymethylpyrimidine kinase/phosphomethylpyrimidine kinase